MTERVLIIGTGLIGGSVGLALKRAGGFEVVGVDASADHAANALTVGAIDEIVGDISSGASKADIIIVATPVGAISSSVSSVASTAAAGTIVTDVGSTKAQVVSEAEALLGPQRSFVGGHPMAGTEGEGISAAREDLFDGAMWILTPTETTDSAAYRRVNTLVTSLGARTLALHPSEHDRLVARVSHLPYAVATALMGLAGDSDDVRTFAAAAGSFRDVTRTAGTNPRVWHDILTTNREAIAVELSGLISKLGSFRDALNDGDHAEIDRLIEMARDARRRLPLKGAREPADPVTIETIVPDRAGVLAEVTTTVGNGGINIEDIWMEHTPSGGALRLVVDGRGNAEKAIELLTKASFRAAVMDER